MSLGIIFVYIIFVYGLISTAYTDYYKFPSYKSKKAKIVGVILTALLWPFYIVLYVYVKCLDFMADFFWN